MGRKSYTKEFQALIAGDMSANLISKESIVDLQDRVLYNVSWNGVGVLGSISIEISDDLKSWTELDFGQPLTVNTDVDAHQILVKDTSYKYIRLIYNFTAGTGTMNVSFRATCQGS